jgi:cytochrome d ubiquinol oxidase subunit I
MLALIVAVPVSAVNLAVGSRLGIVATDYQPMKIAASEALWDTEDPAPFSLFQIGGFTVDDETPSFDIAIPGLLSFLATGSFSKGVEGLNELQQEYEQRYGPGDYRPNVRACYWAMRVMAYLGTLVFLVAALGALLYRRRRLETTRWFHWLAVVTIAFPFVAALSGWVLTEMGRQPWIVQGLLRTSEASSPNVSTWMIGLSLGVFVTLYLLLAVADFVLMRRYARLDPPETRVEPEELPQPVLGF